jgi:hypothetical protein
VLGLCALPGLLACKAEQGSKRPDGGDDVVGLDPRDTAAVEAALAHDGVLGWMHGAVAERGLFVFTLRHPKDFFIYSDFPVVPASAEVATALGGLQRHDQVRVFGKLETRGAQRHLFVDRLEVVKPFEPSQTAPRYTRDATVPESLAAQTELVGRVHAVDAGGAVLVVEVADLVVPIFVSEPEHQALTKDLWRNDKVRVRYSIAMHPNRPAHLRLDDSKGAAIEVLNPIANGHGQPVELEGELTLFPKSPQLTFDIWALRILDGDRVECEYTLVNFEDMKAFEAIRAELAAAWAASPATPVDARNKLVKPGLRVRAKGTLNVISPSQANPQILLESVDDVEAFQAAATP